MKKNSKDRAVIWSEGLSYLLQDKTVDGISVQLFFWAQEFLKNGWEVYAFKRDNSTINSNIIFIRKYSWRSLGFLYEWLFPIRVLLKTKPDVVICRGANRYTYPLVKVCHLFRTKLVFFGASDVNFVPGKEAIPGERNKRIFRKAVPLFDRIVVQNEYQLQTLYDNYKKSALLIPNIWGEVSKKKNSEKCDIIWVANLRNIKRPEWVIYLAKNCPEYKIIMVGATDNDKEYFDRLNEDIKICKNLCHLGKQSFEDTESIISNSRILICTSEFEGFPNTFIQAWCNGVPVVTTVDPSKIVQSNKIGLVVETPDELIEGVRTLLSDESLYKKTSNNAREFYMQHFSASVGYDKLINYLK